jgi:hypothetical protein
MYSILRHPSFLVLVLNFSLLFSVQALAGTIRLPQTGQTQCYDYRGAVIPCSRTGQDGALKMGVAWPQPRFKVSGDCVTDELTGLMWAKNANLYEGQRTWEQALEFAYGLTLCGHSDWRLPNVNELQSVMDRDRSNLALWLNGKGFTNMQSGYYWSSTTQASSTIRAWVANLWAGHLGANNKNRPNYVWPVRSGPAPKTLVLPGGQDQRGLSAPVELPQTGQTTCYGPTGAVISCSGTGQDGELKMGAAWPQPRFTVSGDCVTDELTGLMWAKNANLAEGQLNFQGGLDFTSGLSLCGHRDWRLPNIIELGSLVNRDRSNSAIFLNTQGFSDVQANYYLSSTSQASSPGHVWVINMWAGDLASHGKSHSNCVWPVRSAQGPEIVPPPVKEKEPVDQGRVIHFDRAKGTIRVILNKNADHFNPDFSSLPPVTYTLPAGSGAIGFIPKAGLRLKLDTKNNEIVIFDEATQKIKTIKYAVVNKKENIAQNNPLVTESGNLKKFPIIDREKNIFTIYSERQRILTTFTLPSEYFSLPEYTWADGDYVVIHYKEDGKTRRVTKIVKIPYTKGE